MLPNGTGDRHVLSRSQLLLDSTKARYCAVVCTRSDLFWSSCSSCFFMTHLNSYFPLLLLHTAIGEITYCYVLSIAESNAKKPGCLPSKEVFHGDYVLLRREGGCARHVPGPRPGCDSWRPVSPGDA